MSNRGLARYTYAGDAVRRVDIPAAPVTKPPEPKSFVQKLVEKVKPPKFEASKAPKKENKSNGS